MVMVLKRLHRVGEMFAVLQESTSEMDAVRELLFEDGRLPSRRTFERRLREKASRLA